MTHPAVAVARHQFELWRCGMSDGTAYLHPVLAQIVQIQLAHVQHHVRGDIATRVVHFIQQLLPYRVKVDAPASAGGFTQSDLCVCIDLGDRKPDVR